MDVAPNEEQVKHTIRWILSTLGAMGFGAILAKYPFFTWLQDPNNLQMVAYVIASLAPFVWGMFRHSEAGQVKATESIPAVKAVDLLPTAAGVAIAAKVASPAVQVEQ